LWRRSSRLDGDILMLPYYRACQMLTEFFGGQQIHGMTQQIFEIEGWVDEIVDALLGWVKTSQ
jgi:hypothetical protein